jgi:hypothetical protein
MILYHGTTTTRLPAIYRDGIKPRGRAAGNWEDLGASRADCVYLTDAYALYYGLIALWSEGRDREEREWKLLCEQRPRAWIVQADERKRRKLSREMERQARRREEAIETTLPAVIEIDADRLNPLDLIPDEDAVEQTLLRDGQMLHMAPGELLALIREHTHKLAGQHETSLQMLGTCAHRGTIPPAAITRVAVVNPSKAPELCYFARINSCNIVRFAEVGGQLRDLTKWVFGESSKYFEGPPESEREGIAIMEPGRARSFNGCRQRIRFPRPLDAC